MDVIRGWDADHDGKLTLQEVPAQERLVFAQMARTAGLDPQSPVPLEVVEQKIQQRMAQNSSDSAKGEKSSSGESAVPGFGPPAGSVELAKPPGFGPTGEKSVPLEEQFDARVIGYVDGMLQRYDLNRNGQLDKEEWAGARWSSDPAESDLDKNGVLTREELCKRIAARMGGDPRQGGGPPQGGPPQGGPPPGSPPTGSPPTGGPGPSAGPPSAPMSSRVRDYAQNLLKQYDTNQNGVLEKEEWLKMKSRYHDADRNNDSRITLEELAMKLGGLNSDSSGGGGSSHWSSNSTESVQTTKYLLPRDRLPSGLPDWFFEKDADGDGQVRMAEYSSTWDDKKAAEFVNLDKNNDGLIIPQELLSGDAGGSGSYHAHDDEEEETAAEDTGEENGDAEEE